MQTMVYNKESNYVYTSIKTPFWKASEILGWKRKSAGLGLNHDIIKSCLNNKADLHVYLEWNGFTYTIKYEDLKAVLEQVNCDYFKSVSLKVLPLYEFKSSDDSTGSDER